MEDLKPVSNATPGRQMSFGLGISTPAAMPPETEHELIEALADLLLAVAISGRGLTEETDNEYENN